VSIKAQSSVTPADRYVAMRLRAPLPDDAPAVLALLVARDIADLGTPDHTLEDLLDDWREAEFSLTADALVVELDDTRIAGYGAVRRTGTLAVVAPELEGRGIGARVLQWAEQREREHGRARHRQWIPAKNLRAQAMLRAAGYLPQRSCWRMVRPLGHFAQATAIPVGFALRPLDVDHDAPGLHALDAASFAGNPGYEPESLAAFCDEHLDAHDLDPELSCVAQEGDTIAGFLLARRRQDEAVGYIDLLAVRPDRRRRGLGTSLLETAFARFAAAGLREGGLDVDSDNPRALRLYERAGMRPRFQLDTYERPSLAATSRRPGLPRPGGSNGATVESSRSRTAAARSPGDGLADPSTPGSRRCRRW